jgi:hypothetical protein
MITRNSFDDAFAPLRWMRAPTIRGVEAVGEYISPVLARP